MNNNPLVSVIIPNYNHALYLEERLHSVLNQTYQNFEVIILDDNSTDNSLEIIKKYKKDPHISNVIVNEMNSGSPFKQWQKGFEIAKGELIWIAESDDSCDSSFLDDLVRCYQENTVLVFSRSRIIDENNGFHHYNPQDIFSASFVMNGKDFILEYLSFENLIANASSAIFKKDTALCVNLEYTQKRYIGDWFFWIGILEMGDVAFVSKEHNYFRQHVLNTTKIGGIGGTGVIEHKQLIDYLVKKHYLTGFKKIKYLLFYIDRYTRVPYSSKIVKTKVMKIWDEFYFYRAVLPFYKVSRYLRKLCRDY